MSVFLAEMSDHHISAIFDRTGVPAIAKAIPWNASPIKMSFIWTKNTSHI